MNQETRNEISDFLRFNSSITITNLLSALENKTINLSSTFFEIRKILDDDNASKDVEEILKKIKSNNESIDVLTVALNLLNEIENLQKNVIDSTRLVCTIPEIISDESDHTDLKINELVHNAKKSITIIGYLMMPDKHVQKIFQSILSNPKIEELQIKFIFNKPEQKQELGKTYDSIKKIIRDLWDKQNEQLDIRTTNFPKIYGYKDTNSSLHAKAVIIDSSEILITSANMSDRAIERNFEMGIHHIGESAKDAESLISEQIDNDLFFKV